MPASNMLKLYYFTQAPEELLARTSLHRKDTDDDDQHGNGSGTAEIAAAATTRDRPTIFTTTAAGTMAERSL